jgi:hypothetical protein
MEVVVGEAAATTVGEGNDALPEPALEVVVRSPEIQDVEPIRSAPMSRATMSSCGGSSCWRIILSTGDSGSAPGSSAPGRAMDEGE